MHKKWDTPEGVCQITQTREIITDLGTHQGNQCVLHLDVQILEFDVRMEETIFQVKVGDPTYHPFA